MTCPYVIRRTKVIDGYDENDDVDCILLEGHHAFRAPMQNGRVVEGNCEMCSLDYEHDVHAGPGHRADPSEWTKT